MNFTSKQDIQKTSILVTTRRFDLLLKIYPNQPATAFKAFGVEPLRQWHLIERATKDNNGIILSESSFWNIQGVVASVHPTHLLALLPANIRACLKKIYPASHVWRLDHWTAWRHSNRTKNVETPTYINRNPTLREFESHQRRSLVHNFHRFSQTVTNCQKLLNKKNSSLTRRTCEICGHSCAVFARFRSDG